MWTNSLHPSCQLHNDQNLVMLVTINKCFMGSNPVCLFVCLYFIFKKKLMFLFQKKLTQRKHGDPKRRNWTDPRIRKKKSWKGKWNGKVFFLPYPFGIAAACSPLNLARFGVQPDRYELRSRSSYSIVCFHAWFLLSHDYLFNMPMNQYKSVIKVTCFSDELAIVVYNFEITDMFRSFEYCGINA